MPLPIDDPFAEILCRMSSFCTPARIDAHFTNRRMLLETGALVEKAVQVEQPLGERGRIVRIGVYDLDVIHRHRRPRRNKTVNAQNTTMNATFCMRLA